MTAGAAIGGGPARARFALEPCGGDASRRALQLQAVQLEGLVTLERRHGTGLLGIDYQLRADLGPQPTAVLLPPPAAVPSRRDGLWQHTCLEAFVAVADQPAYWEFNLAPSGDWALYRFTGYRSGQHAPAAAALPFPAPPFTVTRRRDGLRLSLHAPLPAELAAAPHLAIGISAVLEQRHGQLSYWALHHPAPQPDFHRREGFSLRL